MRLGFSGILVLVMAAAMSGCADSSNGSGPSGSDTTSPSTSAPTGTTDGPGLSTTCILDSVETFAKAPAPGFLYGIAVHDGKVYVSTSVGYPGHTPNNDGERIFSFDADGTLNATLAIPTTPASNMGLADLAFDNASAGARLYIVDMNGRVLRANVSPDLSAAETYASIPAPYGSAQWYVSMPIGMAFAQDGSAYVADDAGRIWKIAPAGLPTLWFQDPRLVGDLVAHYGAYGVAIGPDGLLYVSVSGSAESGGVSDSVVFRLPLSDAPQAGDLVEFYRAPAASPHQGPGLTSIAFGSSGAMYAALAVTNEVAVVDATGAEVRRIQSDLFAGAHGMAFDGDRLLVANNGISPASEDPESWAILSLCVQDEGWPLVEPTTIP
ncbi:MAG TPA: hypothetical protein VI796_04115 [Candidatus Thermoplasmatota archaeon]|nr:hypothetical protein [Candidatus Thermoplasmatota archaeon]